MASRKRPSLALVTSARKSPSYMTHVACIARVRQIANTSRAPPGPLRRTR